MHTQLLAFLVLFKMSEEICAKDNVKWRRVEGKGFSLKNYTEKHVTAATCSQVECQSSCSRNDRCTATEFDSANSKCLYLYCNEILLQNKQGVLTSIKGDIHSIKLQQTFWRSTPYYFHLSVICTMVIFTCYTIFYSIEPVKMNESNTGRCIYIYNSLYAFAELVVIPLLLTIYLKIYQTNKINYEYLH